MNTLLPFLLLLLSSFHHASSNSDRRFNAIFNFGSSYEDTGNINFMAPMAPAYQPFLNPPYGETYFHHPTGRASDGRLVIDIIAAKLGFPFLTPSLDKEKNFSGGANFAVSGSTGLDLAFFQQNNITNKFLLNTSLNVQIEWFENMKPSICNTTCLEYFKNSLFMLGKFGDNDYTYMLASGKTSSFLISSVPVLVDTIISAAKRLLKQGVMQLAVAGIRPNGCIPLFLTYFKSTNSLDFDSLGCIRSFNNLGIYHNSLLNTGLNQLRVEFPQANISYTQFYQPIIDFVKNPSKYGFDNGTKLQACCGSGGPYNYNLTAVCGETGATACTKPSTYINWDGIHLTEASHEIIADGWLHGPYADPPILAL